MGKFVDLTGQKFGRLTVIERAGSDKHKKILWLCKCECGNEKVIVGASLKNGTTMSCGCERKKRARETMSKTMKKQWKDEEFRQMMSNKTKEQWKDEEFRQMMSNKTKEQWKDEEFRQMKSEKMKEQWKDEEFRQMKSEKMKEQWENEDFRKMRREKVKEQMKEQWQNEDYRKMKSEKMTKDKNPNYKGGITPITQYLRSSNSQWFEDCKQKANYTCQLTGKHGCKLNTHHLKAFSTIVIEAHKLHNIQIKDQVKDYTQEELKLLEEYVESCHKDNSNAVVLSEDVHKLFHSLYGKGENTPEQFEEFRERYLAGEFKEILK